ncbi:general odorant-binding protein 69-like, partial [Armigeres subalbatus]|uniref:general odorant-binding protein 69-like n=1 Tax=Armigeres subalbatus TaxID=124917 RepID=UPI002ED160B8
NISGVFALVLASQCCPITDNPQDPRRKSFDDAEQQCAEYLFISRETLQRYRKFNYPDEPSVHKLLNCIEIELNAWDEDLQQIKDYVFSQFFVPNTVDCLYKQHTQQCLTRNTANLDKSDRLRQAYHSFQCYNHHYGGISVERKWVPFHFSEVVQGLYDCMHIVPHTNQSLLDYCQGRILTNPDYPKLGYCFFGKSGFYNRNTGMDLEKLYIQFGDDHLINDDTRKCVAGVIDQYCKEPDRFGHIVLDCLIKYLPAGRDIGTAASNALGNPPECAVTPQP